MAYFSQFCSWDWHWVANGFAAGLYFLMFLSVFRQVIRQQNRDFLQIFIATAFLTMGCLFSANAMMSGPWQNHLLETGWLLAALLPGVLFLYLKRQSLRWGRESEKITAKRFNELKDEFLYVASHELRTPLSVINGFAEILVREKIGPLNEEQKRRVRKILMQGQRLNRIVDELLDLSRIRSGRIEVKKDVFDLVPVLKACLDDHQIVCDQQQLTLKDEVPDILPDAEGDIERVMQVIVNLLNNAIKYTGAAGTIMVRAFADKNKPEIRVEVEDTGIGIDAAEQKSVFKEFYRSSHQLARKLSGTGLGLAIVKQLVEAQGGRVGLQSAGIGKGSCFYFTIPTAKPRNAEKNIPASAPLKSKPAAA